MVLDPLDCGFLWANANVLIALGARQQSTSIWKEEGGGGAIRKRQLSSILALAIGRHAWMSVVWCVMHA